MAISPECLVISSRKPLLRVLLPVLDSMKVQVQLCDRPEEGLRRMSRHRYDAVLVGCEDSGTSIETVRKLRALVGGRRAVVLVVVSGASSARESFHAGASFVLQEPLPADMTAKTLRIAYGMMLGERRRYHRHPVDFIVELYLGPNHRERAVALNLSEGGMAVRSAAALPLGLSARACFTLPDCDEAIETNAEVAWTDQGGRSGLRFINLPAKALFHIKEFFLRELARGAPAVA